MGGLTQSQAVAKLDRLFSEVADDRVTFVAGEKSYAFAANQLGVRPDWTGAVAAASRAGDGFGPIRGFRRLHTRFFGAEVLPRLAVSDAALDFALERMANSVDRPPKNAALVRDGLRFEVLPERVGRKLALEDAAHTVVRGLGTLDRPRGGLVLPVVVASPEVTAKELASAARRARIAVSGPVVLRGAKRSFEVPPRRIAALLALPREGALPAGGRRTARRCLLPGSRRARRQTAAGRRIRRFGRERPDPSLAERHGARYPEGGAGPASGGDVENESGRGADDRSSCPRANHRRGARHGHRPPVVGIQDLQLGHVRSHHEPPPGSLAPGRHARRSRGGPSR